MGSYPVAMVILLASVFIQWPKWSPIIFVLKRQKAGWPTRIRGKRFLKNIRHRVHCMLVDDRYFRCRYLGRALVLTRCRAIYLGQRVAFSLSVVIFDYAVYDDFRFSNCVRK